MVSAAACNELLLLPQKGEIVGSRLSHNGDAMEPLLPLFPFRLYAPCAAGVSPAVSSNAGW